MDDPLVFVTAFTVALVVGSGFVAFAAAMTGREAVAIGAARVAAAALAVFVIWIVASLAIVAFG